MSKFYYLDGQNKKGPYTEEELINLNLNNDTLVWKKGFDNWKFIKDIPELKEIIPPPVPPKRASISSKSGIKRRIFYSFIILCICIAVSLLFAYYSSELLKEK